MELAVADISEQASSLNQIQTSPTPMEVDSVADHDQSQEKAETIKDEDVSEIEEKKEEELEPDNENGAAENEEDDEDSKEKILKGILKYEHIYGLDKKSVDFDLDIELIPYDQKDYTVDIQIVKELPKKIVSYRELFKKMAEEEKAAKERAAQGEVAKETEDDDDEIEDTKAFSHLVLKEPPIHHSTNDVDVSSYKALKAATGQNEKNEDFPNTCLSNASQKEEENNLSIVPDSCNIVESGKLTLNSVDAITDNGPNNASQLTELAEDMSLNPNQVINGFSRDESPTNQLCIDRNKENLEINNTLKMEEETQNTFTRTRRRKNNHRGHSFEPNLKYLNGNLEDLDNDMDDEFFNCGHDYLYSDYNDDETTNELMDSQQITQRNNNESQSINYIEPTIFVSSYKQDMDTCDNVLHNQTQDGNEYENQNLVNNVLDNVKDPQDFQSKHLNADINAYTHNRPLQDKHHKVTLESIKEERSFNSSREDLNASPNSTSVKSEDVKFNAEGVIREKSAKRDIGVQTEFDFTRPSNGLLCTCCLQAKPNVEEQNMDRSQNIKMPSLNSDDSIAMLASELEFDCQEDKFTTESSEGNYRDFTQSTSLDCSSSLSMESFEMDDTSLRIEMVNGCPSNDVSM